jgi:signal transduction histidine kinase
MASRIAESLFGAQSDLLLVHRRVVSIGAVVAWCAAALFLVGGFLSGNQDLLIEAIGPIIAGAFMTAQIVMHREHGGIALIGAAFVVVVMYGVVGDPNTLIPAALSLVIICAIGMLFVSKHQASVTAVLGVLVAVIPVVWGVEYPTSLKMGAVMGLSFAMTSMIFYTVRNVSTSLNSKFRVLFEQSPTAAFEEDWSRAVEYLRSEYTGEPERIRQFLLAYPAVVRRAVGLTKIVRANQAAIDLLEADSFADILGSRNPAIVKPTNIEAFVEVLVAAYSDRELFEAEFQLRTFKGREIWLQVRGVNSGEAMSTGTVLMGFSDITHVRQSEAAMEQLIKSKDEFIASVSHELRTPLTAVVGLTSEMASSDMTSDERAELMTLVAGQAEEMTFIVDDLLVAARAEMGTVPISIGQVDLCSQVEAAADGVGIDIVTTCSRQYLALADPARVRQILRNLFTNVDRYGGPNARVVCGEEDELLWVEVRDDGEGVPAEDSERIFESYATAHTGVAASVGLGLAVARQLSELMGGTLVYRRDDAESVFRLELPSVKAPAHV